MSTPPPASLFQALYPLLPSSSCTPSPSPRRLLSPVTKGAVCRLMGSAGRHRCIGSSIMLQESKTGRLPSRHFKTLLIQPPFLGETGANLERNQSDRGSLPLPLYYSAGRTHETRSLPPVLAGTVCECSYAWQEKWEQRLSAQIKWRCITLQSGMCPEHGTAFTQSPKVRCYPFNSLQPSKCFSHLLLFFPSYCQKEAITATAWNLLNRMKASRD